MGKMEFDSLKQTDKLEEIIQENASNLIGGKVYNKANI